MNDIQKIVGVLGHNLDPIIKLLRPKDLAYFASTDKENLSHVQDYLKRVKEKWKEREQYCLEYNWEKRTYIEKGVNPQFEPTREARKFNGDLPELRRQAHDRHGCRRSHHPFLATHYRSNGSVRPIGK